MSEPRRLVLTMTQLNVPPTINRSGRHWAAKARELRPWRDGAYFTYLARRDGRPAGPVTVHVALAFRQNRRRDPHNYVGTVVKAIVDGLVRAGMVPDDTPDWVTVLEPSLVVQPAGPLTCTITVTERTSP